MTQKAKTCGHIQVEVSQKKKKVEEQTGPLLLYCVTALLTKYCHYSKIVRGNEQDKGSAVRIFVCACLRRHNTVDDVSRIDDLCHLYSSFCDQQHLCVEL